MTVGLVLSSLPGYSETFFRNKIHVLKQHGFQVILFTSYTIQKSDLDFKKGPPEFKSNPLFYFMRVIIELLHLLLVVPGRVIRLVTLEWADGKGISQIMKNLYSNSHILRSNLDWLHFGFATQALEKENLATVLGARMAVSFRGYDINVYPMKYPDAYKAVWGKLDKVHSISDSLYHKALKIGLPSDVSYEKITPAIDVRFFTPAKRSFNGGDKLVITTIARLTWIKGLDYAIQAMRILADSGCDFSYQIIGDGILYDRLCFAIHQLELDNYVQLIGRKSSHEIRDILNKTDIYLQPSLEEGFCNAVLEAQACHCMCIVTGVGGLVENVQNGITGWHVAVGDSESIARKIIDVINMSEEEIERILCNAGERIKTEFSIELQQQKFIRFYEQD
ncbi:MAG: glycosyltransferase family 4 protein [Marinilabiliaceae bacterium]|nr:glycosyltransferase family 4 protein [Marinilabiliaceae bacterium]